MRGTSATIVLHHSMVKLPEKPMMPRLFDERVGYFTTRQHGLHPRMNTARATSSTSRAGAWKRKIPAPPFPTR